MQAAPWCVVAVVVVALLCVAWALALQGAAPTQPKRLFGAPVSQLPCCSTFPAFQHAKDHWCGDNGGHATACASQSLAFSDPAAVWQCQATNCPRSLQLCDWACGGGDAKCGDAVHCQGGRTCQQSVDWLRAQGQSCRDAVAQVRSECRERGDACGACDVDRVCGPAPVPPPPASATCADSCLGGSCADRVAWEVRSNGKTCAEALRLVAADCPVDGRCGSCTPTTCPAAPPPPPPPPPPSTAAYAPNFNTEPDYLGISKDLDLSDDRVGDYFYLVIGDFGNGDATGCATMQRLVAQTMKAYVADRRKRNERSRLLFVLAVGDNFYWTGLGDDFGGLRDNWSRTYSGADEDDVDLTSVPWFAVMGNHDWGDSDRFALCPRAPRLTCDKTNRGSPGCGGGRPYVTDPDATTAYQGNQLDAGKQGSGALAAARAQHANWVMPDYMYYYEIPALSFELLAMETSVNDAGGLGGDGCIGGAAQVCDVCGGQAGVTAALQKRNDASYRILRDRAAQSGNGNVAIINHYPGVDSALRKTWLDISKKDPATVLSFSGHEHDQRVEERFEGSIVTVVTGGGGGCCTADLCRRSGPPGGFVAVAFKKENGAVKHFVECFAPDAACTVSGSASRSLAGSADLTTTCLHTNDAGCAGPNGVAGKSGYFW